jgi:hypothetical protein
LEGEPATHDADGNPILERMSDEEYAAYVRKRMWERSHQHIIEERERRESVRERERERRKEHESRAGNDRAEWERRERRGRHMRHNGHGSKSEVKKWQERWHRYAAAWENLDQAVKELTATKKEEEDEDKNTPEQPASQARTKSRKKLPKLPYPTPSSHPSEISAEEIERFYRSMTRADAVPGLDKDAGMSTALLALLKTERVRWHPDKMAQRYGSLGLMDDEARRRVTAVFQVVDALYAKVLGEKG